MNQNNTPVIWTSIIVGVVLLLGMAWMTNSINGSIEDTTIDAPTSEGIANAVLAQITVPTAADIVALIDIPEQGDTYYSVDEKIDNEAVRLATEELDTKDFKRDLMNKLNTCEYHTLGNKWRPLYCEDSQSDADEPNVDDYKDIESITIKDADVTGFPVIGGTRYVEFELKVTYLNDGDDDDLQKARVFVKMKVTDLDYDDDFEDAEVSESYEYQFGDIKVYEN